MSILTRGSLKKVAYPVGIAMALFQLYYTIGYGVLEGSLLAAIFLSFALTMIFLIHPAIKIKDNRQEPTILLSSDILLVIVPLQHQSICTSTMKFSRSVWRS